MNTRQPKQALNLYPIENLADLRISYRLIRIDGDYGQAGDERDQAHKNLNLLAKKIAYRVKAPVALVRIDGVAKLAIDAGCDFSECEMVLNPFVVTLIPEAAEHQIDLGALDEVTAPIAIAFVNFEIRRSLRRRNDIWESSPSTYFRKEPANAKERGREVDIHGGFSFRVIRKGTGLMVAISVKYQYLETGWVVACHSRKDLKRMHGQRMLYHWGDARFFIKFKGCTGRSIEMQKFRPEGATESSTVLEWTKSKAPNPEAPCISHLDPNSPAIQYQNPGNEKTRVGALALCRLTLTNDDRRVRRVHRESIKTPADRFEISGAIIKEYFACPSLAGVKIAISRSQLTVPENRFPYPTLQFAGSKTLPKISLNGSDPLRTLPKDRLDCLLDSDGGVAIQTTLDAQFILAPASLDERITRDFMDQMQGAVSDLLKRPYQLQSATYEVKRSLKDQIDAVLRGLDYGEIRSGRGIVVLPKRAHRDLHNHLKNFFKDRVQFQCVDEYKLERFYAKKQGGAGVEVPTKVRNRYRSYLLNTAFGLLVINRQWPWVLAEGTRCDSYVALDVFKNTAAFCFFHEGGRICTLKSVRSKRKEKLNRGLVRDMVYDQLSRDLAKMSDLPKSIALRRDGRVFDSEWLGFDDAIKRLIEEDLLPDQMRYGAVEVHKSSSIGLRLASSTKQGLKAPFAGAWEAIGPNAGIVSTTGNPFRVRGTPNPVHVVVAHGDLTIEEALEDTFAMTQLAWAAPDLPMRIPIDLHLCDHFLRETAIDSRLDEPVLVEQPAVASRQP